MVDTIVHLGGKNGLKKKICELTTLPSKYLPLVGRYAWQIALRRVSSIMEWISVEAMSE